MWTTLLQVVRSMEQEAVNYCKEARSIMSNANVTKSRETVPNHTSGKIKLTPPAYNHSTVLLVSSLNFGLLTRG